MFDLVVTSPFANYAVGDRITNRDAVKAVLDEGRGASVVKVARLAVEKAKAPAKAD